MKLTTSAAWGLSGRAAAPQADLSRLISVGNAAPVASREDSGTTVRGFTLDLASNTMGGTARTMLTEIAGAEAPLKDGAALDALAPFAAPSTRDLDGSV